MKPNLHVIVASTRPSRAGRPIADWFHDHAAAHGAFGAEIVDLAEWNLPLMNEPHHPRLRQYTHPHTRRWSAKVESADAFVFVMPEYNHGFNAPLKNAIDYLFLEWQYKPVGLVSYGGISGGLRAAQMIKPVLTALKMVPATEAVIIPNVGQVVVGGEVRPTPSMAGAVGAMLDELLRLEASLRPLRLPTAARAA